MRILDFLVYAELNLYFSMFNGVVDGWLTRIEIVEVGSMDRAPRCGAERRGEERRVKPLDRIENPSRARLCLSSRSSFLVKLDKFECDRQTDRQTDICKQASNLAEFGSLRRGVRDRCTYPAGIAYKYSM